MSDYFILQGKEQEQTGPYTMDQMRSMWNAGLITSQTLYWREGLSGWKLVGQLITNLPRVQQASLEQIEGAANNGNVEKMHRLAKMAAWCFGLVVLAYLGYQGLRLYGIAEQWGWALAAPALEIGGAGAGTLLVFALPVLAIYLLPSFLAVGKKLLIPVFAVNLLLGWTVLGWFVALGMAVMSPKDEN